MVFAAENWVRRLDYEEIMNSIMERLLDAKFLKYPICNKTYFLILSSSNSIAPDTPFIFV